MPRIPKSQRVELLKTSLAVPKDLWKRLKIAAIEDEEEAQAIIARLVEAYLRDRDRRKGGKGQWPSR